MIPHPLVEPFPVAPELRPPRRVALVLGTGLCALAMIGALVWVMTLTPFAFHRFDAFEAGTTRGGDRVEDITQPGTYLVFEERAGASTPSLPPPVTIGVTSKQGDIVPVEALVKPFTQSNPLPYRTPWHEGRAIAKFTISEPGLYHVRAVPVSRRQTAGYSPRLSGTSTKMAVGREAATTWMGAWPGAVVLVAIPLVAGIGCLLLARRNQRRRAVSASRSVEARPPSSLTAHG